MKLRSIISCIALGAASSVHAGYTPIVIQTNSYNADVVVESNATPRLTILTTASIDEGTNNYNATLFERGLDLNNPNNGLPPANTTFTSYDNANYTFKMAPSYVGANGLLIDSTITTGTFTPVTPTAYVTLSFLGLGGNGGDTISAQVFHQDGTSETKTFATSDWFGGTTGIAVIMGGRLNQVYNLNTETDGTSGDGLGNPRVYHKEITLTDTNSAVTNIVLTYVTGSGGSHSDVMAVSGSTVAGGPVSPIAVTGYDYDFVVEASAPQNGRLVSQTIVNGTNVWATDQSIDNTGNTGNSWYEQGYNLNNDASGTANTPTHDLTGTGIPHAGSFLTNSSADHVYQMPPTYVGPDAVYISSTITNAAITLTTPAAYTGLSFLASAGNGPVVVQVIINHTGGVSETNALSVADWFNGSAPAALIVNGRVIVTSGQFQNIKSGFPRLMQNDIVLTDTTDPVTSISILNTNAAGTGGRFSILAVSGSQGALPPGITLAPLSISAYAGSSATFTANAAANAPLTYVWQKGTNGVYVNLINGGDVSGATTTNLTISPIAFADQADYRMVATDSAGSAATAAGTLSVYSTETDVTQPGDPISAINASPFGDGPPSAAIDNNMSSKFGANISGGIAALVVSPTVGRTIVNTLRIYSGNDTTGRDPTSFVLQGSLDGGSTYTTILSNSISIPDGRNANLTGAPNPLTEFVAEVRFNNSNGYTTYKLSFPTYKANTGQVQFQEIELLGVADTSQPFFNQQPVDAYAFNGTSASFYATASYNPTPTISWKKKVGSSYVALTDGGNISGSQTTSLNISPATFSDAADYIAVANSTAGAVTSSVAHLYIYSTATTVAQPGDPIVGFGDTTGTRYSPNTDAMYVINGDLTEWINGGSGPSAGAGFSPFGGPVGVVLTPSVGSTVLSGLRFYPGADPAAEDPGSYTLEGSNDGGTTYSAIASGALSLPIDRNSVALAVDPTQARAQEVLFNNAKGYTSYRLTFPTTRDPNNSAALEIGEVEFLGVAGAGVSQPTISSTSFSGGNLSFSLSGGSPNGTYSVLTNGTLTQLPTGWGTATSGSLDGSGNASVTLPVNASMPTLFYVIKTP